MSNGIDFGVRPIVSLGSWIQATGIGTVDIPWVLSKNNCTHIWDEGVQIKAPTTTEVGQIKYTCTLCKEPKIEEIPMIVGVPILSVAKVGDYVTYESDKGVTSWRVFDIRSGEVLITPANGPVGSVTLNNSDGYVNTVIESTCDEYTNSTLGITTNDVRSMTAEDINRITGYTPPEISKRRAYYLNEDTTYTSGTITYRGNSYEKVKHVKYLYQKWTAPRFYTWDYAENTAIDENGIEYAYPTVGAPVLVSDTYYSYELASYNHISNNSISIGSLLGSDYGWLHSQYVGMYSEDVQFGLLVADSSSVSGRWMTYSDGYQGSSLEFGVRPLVSLGSWLQVKGKGTSGSPWVVFKIDCRHTWDEGVQTKEPTTTETGIKVYTCTLCGEMKKEEIPIITSGSILSVATIGDYVNYSSNGVTSWRVFDIRSGEVLITPASGPVGELTLGGADGYMNGISKIENACDTYTNSELGITTSDVRSMKVQDINRISGYTIPVYRYAYYLQDDSTYTSGTVTYGGNSYKKVKHTSYLYSQSWKRPRFYEWDYAENTAIDENGIRYAYPTRGKPVYVTDETANYDPSYRDHISNSSVTVESLLGTGYGWLADKGSNALTGIAVDYLICTANADSIFGGLMISSEGLILEATLRCTTFSFFKF